MSLLTSGSFAGTTRFQILRNLGTGGMGVVYEALDCERGARVALKRLRSMSPDGLLRFKNEFRDFQNLSHPNLISLGELHCAGTDWFFTMELVEGSTFLEYVRPVRIGDSDDTAKIKLPVSSSAETMPDALLDRISPSQDIIRYDEDRLRAALRQLAEGLQILHQAHKVHRDLKPSNVLIAATGRLVILDFGLATDTSRSNGYRSEVDVVGTVEYMAPEQAAGRSVGPPADWYSVGVMLYEAISGKVPLSGSAMDVLMNKQRVDAPSVRVLCPKAPADLDALCADLLRFNPSERPTGTQVLMRLGAALPSSSPPSLSSFSTSSHFIGRERELKILRESMERARSNPAMIAICGESGVGKTALVRRFTEQVQDHDPTTVVLAGTCYERESVPFKAVDGIFDALCQFMRRLPKGEAAALLPRRAALLAQVFPVLARVEAVAEAPRVTDGARDPQELRNRLFIAVRELLSRLCDRRPVVLVIDDLQWADADSLALLNEVLRPPEAPQLLLVATVRTAGETEGEAAQPPLSLPLLGIQELRLGRMAPAEARELAQALIRRAQLTGPLRAQAIAQEAAGHPLFIDELIRYASTVHSDRRGPISLEEALGMRIAQLDEPARHVLDLCCLSSGRLVQQTGAQAAGMSFGDFAKHVAFLRVGHLLRTSGVRGTDYVEPYHGRVRAAVLAHLPAETTVAYHRRLAVALETSGQADPEALAIHWRDAGDSYKAAEFAAQAAEKAARALAFDRAARFYQLCLELRADAPLGLRVALGEALVNAGRGGEAGRVFLQAATMAGPAEALDLRRRAAEQLLRSGHIDEGLQAIQSVLDSVGMRLPRTPRQALFSLLVQRGRVRLRGLGFRPRDPSQLSAKALSAIDICSAVSAGLGIVDTIRGADFQARQLLLALQAGEPERIVRALAMETAFLAVAGSRSRRRTDKLLTAARALAEQLGQPHGLGLAMWASGMAAFLQGHWSKAHALLADAETILRDRCVGTAWELDSARFIWLWSSFYRGRIRDLRQRVPHLLRESRARGDLYAITNLRTAFLPVVLLANDNPDGSREEARDAMERWSRQGFHIQHLNGIYALVQADLYQGQGERAAECLAEHATAIQRSLLLKVQQIRIRTLHLRGCIQLTAQPHSPAAAEREATALEGEGVPWARALALALRAGVARVRGEIESASSLFVKAADELAAADMALYASAARRRAGELRGGEEGAALVQAADDWMTQEEIAYPERMASLLAP
jgi:serine/threonine protein kinase